MWAFFPEKETKSLYQRPSALKSVQQTLAFDDFDKNFTNYILECAFHAQYVIFWLSKVNAYKQSWN